MTSPGPAPGRPGPLVCPLCRTDLDRIEGGSHRCPSCKRTYPEVAGIPDLRVVSDRYLTLDEDRAKAERLAGREDLSFIELLEEYWRLTPEVPGALAARYVRATAEGAERGDTWLRRIGYPGKGESLLEVGCGTGGVVAAAARAGAVVTGVDIALRWLVLARRLCDELGVTARLLAADGGLLPLRGGTFDRTVSIEAVEHARDQRGFLQSCILSARPGGRVDVVVANRYSLGPDPAVGLFGLGFMPRPLARQYVSRRRRTRYQFFRSLSGGELRSLVGLRNDVAVVPGPLPPPSSGSSSLRRTVDRSYEGLRRRPSARILLSGSPFLLVTGAIRDPGVNRYVPRRLQ